MNARHPNIEWLSKSVDGMLGSKLESKVHQHLVDCAICQNQLKAFHLVKETLGALPAIEERILREPQTPLFIVQRQSHLLNWAARVSVLASLAIVSLTVLRPGTEPVRIISSSSASVTSEMLTGSQIGPDTTFRTLPKEHGEVDLEMPHQMVVRLKPGTSLTWQQVNRPLFSSRAHIVVNLMRGEMVARTKDEFWGSRLQVKTPTATANVKGTAFSVTADPATDSTTLKVLAGSIFFSPHMGDVGVEVKAGETSRIHAENLPQEPHAMSSQERKALLEAYRIGQDPAAVLVLGAGPERVEELFQPALLYVTWQRDGRVHPFIRKTVDEINDAILENRLGTAQKEIENLEAVISHLTDPKVSVPLRMFLGACWANLGVAEKAQKHFRWVHRNHPKDLMAPLSLVAIARVYEVYLNDIRSALGVYQEVVRTTSSRSPEGIYAREFVKNHES